MGMPKGVYTITNSHHQNVASLPNANDREPVVGMAPSASDSVNTTPVSNTWSLIPSSNNRYIICDPKSDRWLRPKFSAQSSEGDAVHAVYGSSEPFYWRIIQDSDRLHTIHPFDDLSLSWSLHEDYDLCPVELRPVSEGRRCRWKISPLFDILVELSLAKEMSNEQGFTCEIGFGGLDPYYVLHFQEPILIEYGRDVIAKSDIQRLRTRHDNRDKPNTFYPVLRVTDWLRFRDLAIAVLQDEEVPVVWRATAFKCYPEGNASHVSDIFESKTRVTFKGFDSFRQGVQLNDVKILGSKLEDTGKPYLDARATAIFSSSSTVQLGASITVDVYYVHTNSHNSSKPDYYQIGVATIKNLRLIPHRKVRQEVEWKFLPPGTSLNEDVNQFISKYLTTDEEFTLSLHVKEITTNICGHEYSLPDLRDVKATTRGQKSLLVTHADAYVGWSLLYLSKEISLTFDFENPIEAPLTIEKVEAVASMLDVENINLRCSFESFTIPGPRGEPKRSPLITNAKIVTGYWTGFTLLIRQLLSWRGFYVDVNVKSANAFVGDFKLDGLSFNIEDVPVTMHL
ncbi:hypothetical protein BD410DRAFT_900408 [Rickenella mellea]|uniref:Uncharacterized protein n=1 Tax=Rickenella mellea TaxID=50990 RepID=A0A4Y7PUX7_9AGAM|nr:hypothetical protein BD410DRAFT_900408 [Rickenella mellea]